MVCEGNRVKLKYRMMLFASLVCLDCLLAAALLLVKPARDAGKPLEAGARYEATGDEGARYAGAGYEAIGDEEASRGGNPTTVEGDSGEDKVERKVVALTFDDGPHKFYTEKLLDGLKERGVKATFFLIGESIEGNEELVRRMSDDGHLIGNHTYHHVQLTKETKEQALEEITLTNERILEITGMTPTYIRPPFGSWSEELAEEIDMTPVLWSVDPKDWKSQNSGMVTGHILKNTKDGDIILLHDIFSTSVDAALQVVDRLVEEGYTFVTVEDLLIE